MHNRLKLFKLSFIFLFTELLILGFPTSHGFFALPEPEQVVSGSAEFSYPDASSMQINASDKAIVNYKSFDIKQGESVIINLPSVNNEILNRVTGLSGTTIAGNLTCNGVFILINERGIFFAPSANVDVGALIASTRDISNADFLSSKYNFQRMSKEQLDTLLLNQGTINVRKGGFGVLIAGAVENQGTIICPMGTIALAGGDMIRLDIAGNGLISVAIDQATAAQVVDKDGNPVTDQIKNTGTLQADGGVVLLKAEALPGIFEKAINLEGYVRADKLENKKGVIKIVSSGKVTINAQVSATQIQVGQKDEAIPEIIEMHTGSLTAEESVSVAAKSLKVNTFAPLTEIYKTGEMKFTSSSLKDSLITLEGEGINVTYLKTGNLTLQTDNSINTTPGLIIQATQVRLYAKQFGTLDVPLTVQANLTYINRTQGNIEIMESVGLGSTIMLRGPPSGFGAIIYNKDTNLILEAEKITLRSAEPTYFYGNITFYNFECTTPGKVIYFEAGKTYTFKGSLNIAGAPDQGPEEYFVKLRSQETGKYWYLDIQSENYTLDLVNIRDAYALNPIFIPIGVDAGHNYDITIDPTWDGGGTTYLWSDANNWSGNSVPTGSEAVTFDSTSTKDSLVDAAFGGTIASLTISSGYTGTISLARNLTVTGAFNQAAGTFNETYDTTGANAYNLTAGSITKTGGTFNGPHCPGGATTPATRIASVADLETIYLTANLGKNYVQTANIDLTGVAFATYIIGNSTNTFTGKYNGYGYSISNLTISASGTDYVGLFGYAEGATLQNIGLTSVSITATYNGNIYVGGLVGYSKNTSISGSSVTGSIQATATGSFNDVCAGGLVGYNIANSGSASISNSYTSANVTANSSSYAHAGGLVGRNEVPSADSGTANISSSYATGNITATGSTASYAGGLVGRNNVIYTSGGSASITNSYATGNATANGSSSVSYAGGLVGSNCVYSDNSNVNISTSYATGSATASGSSYNCAGGLVGYNTQHNYANSSANITNSYATGNATSSGSTYIYAGGLVGYNAADSGGSATISYSYSVGLVTGGASYSGGLVGANSSGSISNSYYNSDTSGKSDNDGRGVPKTTSQMMTQSTFSGWDFTNTWNIIVGNETYPYLRAITGATAHGISGIAYSGQGSGPLGNVTIGLAVNGTLITTVSTVKTGNNGFFYFLLTDAQLSSGDKVLVYQSTSSPYGSTYNVAASAGLTGLDIYGGTLIIRYESGSAVTNANLNTARGSVSTTYTCYAGSGSTLDVNGNLLIWTGKTFAPGGNITVSGSWINNGTFTCGTDTVTFDGTGTQNIASGGSVFYNFTVNKSSGSAVLQDALHVDGTLDFSGVTFTAGSTITAANLTITAGTLDMAGNDLTINEGGALTNSGTIKDAGSGTDLNGLAAVGTWQFTINGATIPALLNYKNLTISGNAAVNSDITITGTLTVDSGKTFSVSKDITLTLNPGSAVTLNGTIDGSEAWMELVDSTGANLGTGGTLRINVRFNAQDANVTVPGRSYGGQVEIYNGGAVNRTALLGTAGGQTISCNGSLLIRADAAGNMIVDADTYDPTIDLEGSFKFSGIGAGIESVSLGSGSWYIAGGIDFTGGEITAGGSTLICDANYSKFASLGGTGLNNSVKALIVYNGYLIVGGVFTGAGGDENANKIAKWDGTSWSSLGGENSGLNNAVYALTIYNGNLIAGGLFTDAGGDANADKIAKWNGTAWSSLGGENTGLNNEVDAFTIYNGNLIAGGWFTDAGGDTNADYIAKWNGTAWSSLGGENTGLNSYVWALTIYNSNLIAGGNFTDAGGDTNADKIAKWNGTAWSSLGGAGTGLNGYVFALIIYNSNLIAGGNFTNAGGDTNADYIAKWNGTAWSSLGGAGSGLNNSLSALIVYNGNLIAGGGFSNAGGDANADDIAQWNGTAWSSLGGAGTGLNDEVYALTVYNGELIFGGDFDNAGGDTNADYIVKFNPTTITTNNQTLNNITFNGGDSAVYTLRDQLNCAGLTMSNSTLDVGNSNAISVTGTLRMDAGAITGTNKNINITATTFTQTGGSIYTTTSGDINITTTTGAITLLDITSTSGSITLASTSGGNINTGAITCGVLDIGSLASRVGTVTITGDISTGGGIAIYASGNISTQDLTGNNGAVTLNTTAATSVNAGDISSPFSAITISAPGAAVTFSSGSATTGITVGSAGSPVASLNVSGNIATFDSGDITITASGTITIGSLGSGTTGNINLTSSGTSSLGSITCWGITFSKYDASAIYRLTSGTTVDLAGTLTINTGVTLDLVTNNANLDLTNDTINNSGTISFGSGTLTTTGLTITNMGSWEFNTTGTIPASTTYATLTLNGSGATFTAGGAITTTNLTITAGTLAMGANALTVKTTLSNSGLITVSIGSISIPNANVGDWTFTGNNFIPPASYGTLTLNKDGGTFNATGDLVIHTKLTITAGTLNMTENDLTFQDGSSISNNGTITIGSGTLSVTTPALSHGNVTFTETNNIPAATYATLTLNKVGGTFTAQGRIDATNLTITAGTLVIGANSLTVNTTLSNSGLITVAGGTITIPNAAAGNWTFTESQVIPAATYGTLTLNKSGGLFGVPDDITASNLTLTAGTLAMGNNDLQVDTSLTNSGTISMGTGSLSLPAGATYGNFTFTATRTVPASTTYATLTLNGSGATFTAGGAITTTNLTITAGTLAMGANALTVKTTLSNSGTISMSTGSLSLPNGATYGNFTFTATRTVPASTTYGTLTLNGSGATFTAGGAITATNLTITAGTLAMGANALIVNTTLSNSGTITVSTATIIIPNAAAGNWTFTGTNTVPAATYSTVIFNGTGATFTLADAITATDLTITAGTLDANGKTLTVSGDFTNSGTFSHGNGTVIFNDSSRTSHIHGTTFNNLTCTTPGKELVFDAGATETINGTLTLTGVSGNFISLRSSTTGSQWKIDPEGTINVSCVDVQDSWNLNGVYINPANSVDRGNNTYWFSPPSALNPRDVEGGSKSIYNLTPDTGNLGPSLLQGMISMLPDGRSLTKRKTPQLQEEDDYLKKKKKGELRKNKEKKKESKAEEKTTGRQLITLKAKKNPYSLPWLSLIACLIFLMRAISSGNFSWKSIEI